MSQGPGELMSATYTKSIAADKDSKHLQKSREGEHVCGGGLLTGLETHRIVSYLP